MSGWVIITKKYKDLSTLPCWKCIIRLIPQGTVNNNPGPDHLAGPKALDPNSCRQPTLWLHGRCLEVLTVHGTELRLFWTNTFPLLILLVLHIGHSSSRYNFNVFSYDAVLAEHRTLRPSLKHHVPSLPRSSIQPSRNERMRYVFSQLLSSFTPKRSYLC